MYMKSIKRGFVLIFDAGLKLLFACVIELLTLARTLLGYSHHGWWVGQET